MRLSNNLLRVHVAGFEKGVVALRVANGAGRLHEEIAELFSQNVQEAGDDNLALAVRAAMKQIAAAVPDLPAQQAGKYQNWLLTRYRQNWIAQTQANPPQPLLLEDLFKYADDFTLYHNTPNIIKKRAGISTDLFAIDSPFELYQQLKALRDEMSTEFKPLTPTQQAYVDNHEAVIIGQTAQWRLVMPLTTEASQEFGSGTRWCTAAQKDNRFTEYFPDHTLLYLEASGVGKHAFVLQKGKITDLFDAEDTKQTPEQQQALLNKLPTLAAQLQKLDEAMPLLQPIIDKADLSTVIALTIANRNLAPYAAMNENVLIEKFSRSNLTQADKDKYLGKAAEHGLLAATKALVKYGANIHAHNDAALGGAAKNGHTETVRLLLEHGADVHAIYDLALRLAASNGHTETVRLLLDHGADVHADNNFALRSAAGRGHTETVRLLLEYGADIHADNDYILCFAATFGHAGVVKLLLQHGANEHFFIDEGLRRARMYGHTEVIKILEAHIAKQAAAQTPSAEKPLPQLNSTAKILTQ